MRPPEKPNPFLQDWTAARECLGPEGMLSVVLPVYNLAEAIEDNLRRCVVFFQGNIPYELIPVDDGSADGTAEALRRAAATLPHVRPVFLERNGGKGAALRAGVDASHGSHILLLDGDLDLVPEPIPNFFRILREREADIVIGSKMHPESAIDYPLRRRIASAVYYGLVKLLVHLPVHDTQTGMKLFKAKAVRFAFDRMLAKRFAFDLEVLAIAHAAGYRIAEAPVKMDFGNKMGSLTARNVRETLNDTLAVFYRLRILRYYDRLIPLPTPDVWPSISVVIACPGPSAMLRHALEALAEQRYPGECEAIVLPDAAFSESQVPSPESRTGKPASWQTGKLGLAVRILPTGKVRPAEKRNLGIREAKGEIVAFLDDDASPQPGWLQRAARYFAAHPDVASVGGPAITPPDDPWLAKLSGRVYANPLVSGAYCRRYTPGLVCREEDLPSCNLFVRASVLREIGGFDTRHWPGEDTLLCQTITRDLGLTMMYDPWVCVTHHRRPLFGPHLRQVGRYALHRGVFARRDPGRDNTSRRAAYFVPSLFLLGVALGPFAGIGHPILMWAYLGVLAFYAALVLVTTASPLHPISWLVTALGVVATHLWYGARFLIGICGRRLPSEVRSFDHRES